MYPLLKRKVGRPSKNDIKIRLKLQKDLEEKQAAVSAARAQALQEAATAVPTQRRKYTKRKKDGMSGIGAGQAGKRDFSPFDEEMKRRELVEFIIWSS